MAGIEEQKIMLQGELSFFDIIGEAENQLGIQIELPRTPDQVNVKNYKQEVQLKTILGAIQQDYAQDGIPVAWKISGKVLKVFRTDRIKRSVPKKGMDQIKKENFRSTPKKKEVQREKNIKPKVYPTKPNWAYQNTPKRNPTTSPSVQRNQFRNSKPNWSEVPTVRSKKKVASGLEQFDDDPVAFHVQIPSKKKKAQPKPVPKEWEPKRKEQSNIWTKQQNREGGIRVTPYPKKATAFINDAPSIVPGGNKEIYVEWEARMLGALQQNNLKVLHKEKREVERRLKWLRRHMP